MPTPIKPEHVKAFKKHANALAKLIKEIQRYCPEANIYVAMDDMHLMKGPSHDADANIKAGEKDANHQNTVASVFIPTLGGGDW